jgi:hypothetical protein
MISSMEAPQHDGFEINVMEEKVSVWYDYISMHMII